MSLSPQRWHLQIEWHTQLLHQVCSRILRWHAWQRTWLPLDEAACTQSCHSLCIHLRAYTAEAEMKQFSLLIQIHQIRSSNNKFHIYRVLFTSPIYQEKFSTYRNRNLWDCFWKSTLFTEFQPLQHKTELCESYRLLSEDSKNYCSYKLTLNWNLKESSLLPE